MRNGYISVLILFLMSPLINSTPAFATDTQTAVNTCINTEGCTYDCEATTHGVDCLITAPGGAIIHCDYNNCYVAGHLDSPGNPTKKPVNVTPIIKGKPVQAPPHLTPPRHPRPKPRPPVHGRPIRGKPVQAPPSTNTNHPILLEKGSGGSGKH